MNIIRQIDTELGTVFDTMFSVKEKKIIAGRLYLECPDGMSAIDFDVNSIAVNKWLDNARQIIEQM